MAQEAKQLRNLRGEWVGDATYIPNYLTSGSVFVLRQEPPEELGIYLPDGTWQPIKQAPRRMGF